MRLVRWQTSRRCFPQATTVLGENDRDTLEVRLLLAHSRGKSGDAHGAAEDLDALIPDMGKALGSDHPMVQAARDDLAYWGDQIAQPTGD